MHHFTCGISSLLCSVNPILSTLLLIHLTLHASPHHSPVSCRICIYYVLYIILYYAAVKEFRHCLAVLTQHQRVADRRTNRQIDERIAISIQSRVLHPFINANMINITFFILFLFFFNKNAFLNVFSFFVVLDFCRRVLVEQKPCTCLYLLSIIPHCSSTKRGTNVYVYRWQRRCSVGCKSASHAAYGNE